MSLAQCDTLESYLSHYGPLLGRKAVSSLSPLHVPGEHDALPMDGFSRQPFEPQAHVITAGVKAIRRQKSLIVCGEMGTGKTLIGACICHTAAKGRPYRALVMCPDHLVDKWKREIEATIPEASVFTFEKSNKNKADDSWKDALRFMWARRSSSGRKWVEPLTPEWVVVGRNQSKWDPEWIGLGEKKPKFVTKTIVTGREVVFDEKGDYIWENGHKKTQAIMDVVVCCPECGQVVHKKNGNPMVLEELEKKQHTCPEMYLQEFDPKSDRVKGHAVRDDIGDRVGSGLDRICPIPDRYSDARLGRVIVIDGRRYEVRVCGAPLWSWTAKPRKWAPARILHKKCRGMFGYFILDEMHEEKSDESAQSMAAGKLMASCDKTIGLTGTLIGGYANHIFPLLLRMAPKSLCDEGFEWGHNMAFLKAYGRVDTIVTAKDGEGGGSSKVRGSTSMRRTSGSTNKREAARPGIMPTIFGRHLIGTAAFIGLEEMTDELPELVDFAVHDPQDPRYPGAGPVPVAMDADQAQEYGRIAEILTTRVKELLKRGSMKLLGAMLHTLMDYPDRPFDWKPRFEGRQAVGYFQDPDNYKETNWVDVCQPADLCRNTVRPKEKALVDLCIREVAAGRQVWVYVQMTNKRDVQTRLAGLLEEAGLKAGVLRSTAVKPRDREAWIEKQGKKYDVILSHPVLVQTGLDLFSKREGGHNFATIVFYETGYNLFTMRQAARRAWRIGQQLDCRVYYLYYEQTMQQRAMSLMAKKMKAANQLEGKFSAEGLVAMTGEDNDQMAMAKSLNDSLEDVRRNWGKIAPAKQRSIVKLARSGALDILADRASQSDVTAIHAGLVAEAVILSADEPEPHEEVSTGSMSRAELAVLFRQMQELGIDLDNL